MTSFSEYQTYDALGLAELVAKGEVTPKALLETAIERLEVVNSEINTIVNRR